MNGRIASALGAAGLLAAWGCSAHDRGWRAERDEAVLFSGMGSHHRPVTTSSPMAQRYFDQGLTWAYAFNHDEAIRSFEAATKYDPNCAMAWWGIALCHGPHINNPIVPVGRSRAATAALRQAVALRNRVTKVERDLIDALTKRYADPPVEDRAPLDLAYAEAMRTVWQNHQDDGDVGTLYAEALMDLRPWDLWTQDGKPQPGTEKILAVLEEVLRQAPNSPGANHLYIHAVEASPNPERANAAADRLREMVPVSGHLVHMPSHIDVLTGRWALASQQNEKAIKSDRAYRRKSPRQGFYRVSMLHNHHMLSFASMMEGRSKVALRAAREAVESVPEDFRREHVQLVDPYMGAVYDALKRFGKWDEILREPAPPDYLPITTAMWRFNRALAYAAKGQVESAEREKAEFLQAAADVPDDAVTAINKASDILNIARHMLDGEIAFRRGEIDESIAHLRKAIAVEDQLLYMKPPEWIQPVRHTLGAVLLSAGRYDEAEQVYREDLEQWPHNGWSLYGLGRCLRARGATAEAQEVERRFRKAWSRADMPIQTSCLCVPNV